MKELNPTDPIGQNVIKLISNVCFSVFVFSVLIFTVIAITYQPPDPWESARALTKVFTDVENATFQIDTSVLKTGEDIVALAPAPMAEPPVAALAPGAESSVERPKEEPVANNASLRSVCEDVLVVNCSDPKLLTAIKRFNSRFFKAIVFLEYQAPVNGSNPDECDVTWRFRNKKERSWRRYRDFRRFKIGFKDDCSYKVVRPGRWHSGVNARPPRIRANAPRKGTKAKVVPSVRDDEINDTIPEIGTDFKKGRYLYYSRGGDHCKGMNQYLWSFLCALGEARFLNRTFVMDLRVCLASTYTKSGKAEEGKDFRFYFDFEHLKETSSIVEENEFLKDWKKWDKSHHRSKVSVRKVKGYKVTPLELKKENSTVLWRQFNEPAKADNYWYRVCEGPAGKYIERPWQALWKSKRLMNIVTAISGSMDWDFDAVHVVRGWKANNKQLWPNLDADTSPAAIAEKLRPMVGPGRNLYVATNEAYYGYFDKLRSQYKVHLLEDYRQLWGNTSEWYNETTALNGGRAVEFDGYMRVAVDTEVLYRAKKRVETFYDLTKDCKDGINTC